MKKYILVAVATLGLLPLMRGRHSTAILGLMGVTETIATPLSSAALGYVFSDTLVVFDVNARVKADGPCVLAGQ